MLHRIGEAGLCYPQYRSMAKMTLESIQFIAVKEASEALSILCVTQTMSDRRAAYLYRYRAGMGWCCRASETTDFFYGHVIDEVAIDYFKRPCLCLSLGVIRSFNTNHVRPFILRIAVLIAIKALA